MRFDGTFIEVAKRKKDGKSEIWSKQARMQETSHIPIVVRI